MRYSHENTFLIPTAVTKSFLMCKNKSMGKMLSSKVIIGVSVSIILSRNVVELFSKQHCCWKIHVNPE